MDPSVLLLLISLGLLVLVLSSRRRQQREQQALQGRLVPGAEVMTGSGLFATVVSLDDVTVVLETGPGQHARWDRRSIARLLSVPDEPGADGDGVDDDQAVAGRPERGQRADDPVPPGSSASSDRADDPDQGNVTASGDDTGAKDTGQSKHG